ncbi:hypothetical protein GCM10009765_28150 [Fodinicola feengrottensis]|uniref:Uncharacterized protein n=1 Tax=Fodinicola feengrottensis TaxID=435914 RepID=A0ABN2GUV2_9ACTN
MSKQQTERDRWQSARDAWDWARQVDEVRALLRTVDDTYVIHTKSASLLMASAASLLRARAESEISPSKSQVWRGRANLWCWAAAGPLAYYRLAGRPITVEELIGNVVTGTLIASVYAVIASKWGVRSRRRRLGEGPTTPATVDFATERQAPATTDSQAYLAYLAWRAGHLGQASRLLLMPSRLQAARDREAFRVDVSLATIYLFDSMESLKSLSEYVESVGAGEKGGELR